MLNTPMKIGIVIYGSNGDIELMVSLAQGLAKEGHQITLFIISINRRDYSLLNNIAGIDVTQGEFPASAITEDDVEFWSKSHQDMADMMERRYQLVVDDVIAKAIEYSQQCDVIIGTTYMLEVHCIAQKFNTPYVSLRPFAGHVRSEYEQPFYLPCENFPGFGNLELWDICDAYMNKFYKRRLNKLRREQGLAPVTSVARELLDSPWLNLIAYSNILYPPKPDWDDSHHQCGFFKSPSYIDWDLPTSLEKFLEDKAKPVFITVGTMMEYENDRAGFRARLLALAHSINRPVIIHADWPEDTETINKNVYLLRGFIAYGKIIPLCDLAIHHGGVGTTHIIAELGCPSIIISYGFEHPFSCKALAALDAYAGSITRSDFCEATVKQMVDRALENPQLSARIKQLSLQLKHEDGVANAVKALEQAYTKLMGQE